MILASLLLLLAQPSSVLVVVVDDFGWSERDRMPLSLDALADAGTTFTRAYSFPVCTTSRVALLFGRYPRREGVGDLMNAFVPDDDELSLDPPSLAEIFGPTRATMLIGKWHMGRAPLIGEMNQTTSAPFCHGFDGWRAGTPNAISASATGYYSWWRVQNGNLALSTQYATDAQRDAFLSWWGSTAEPKFCVLAWSAPHGPFDPPPGQTAQSTTRENYEQVIDYLDEQLATVLSVVSLEDTFVVFTSDNGTPEDARPIGSPDLVWKGSTFEGGVRVPLIVAGPGISAGVETARLVSLSDIGTTLAEVSGVAVQGGFEDSVSFADALGPWAGEPARTFVFAERYGVETATTGYPEGYDDQAVIEAQWKLRRVDADGFGPNPTVDRFYHLTSPGVELPLTPSRVIQDRLIAELASIPPRAP